MLDQVKILQLALAELDSFAAWVQYRVAAGFDWAK
jgi:hypothetical protein